MPLNGALTSAMQAYLSSFASLVTQFLQWGQWVFFGLLVLNLMWFWVWMAFQKGEFDNNLADFLRKFFILTLFYTLMMNHGWLLSILQSVQVMGKTITNSPTDPSSIISDGIALADSIMEPVKSFDIFHITFGAIIILIVYVVIIFTFISIALQLAVTIIITTALISLSTFFLSFAALEPTAKIAHHILEAILANCMKLLGIYLVVGTGTNIIINLAHLIPAQEASFDDYWWLLSAVLLFWMLAKQLPEQLGRLVSFHLTSDSHTNAASISMAILQYAKIPAQLAKSLMKDKPNIPDTNERKENL